MWPRIQALSKKIIALLMLGVISPPLWLVAFAPKGAQAQDANSCANIALPLTAEEEVYARTAWQYFVNNYQESTGFTNSSGGYPSGTLWDMGNYLMALNSVRWMGIIDQGEFDMKLNKFLSSLGGLRLFEDSLPNKVYNAANGELVDYGNNPVERGIGWSALDIGRVLAAFHVLRTCHPQYADWLKSIVDGWALDRSLDNGYLYGAAVLEDGQTLLVQEGRLGYEEYAVRGYELWDFSAPTAGSFEPYQLVDIYGVKIPVDTRNFQATNANNYVVSESYILDGIEFGFLGNQMQDFAKRVFEVQRRRYLATGQLTAVTEDNIDGPPYFLYNTIFSNGEAWATITEKNELYREKRSISTKAAFGWRYIFPDSEYAQQLFEVAKGLMSPDGGGFYAGMYEETNEPNQSLTGNTNGLIIEILYYKARGYKSLIGGDGVNASTGKPDKTIVMKDFPAPENIPADSPSSAPAPAPPPPTPAVSAPPEPKSAAAPPPPPEPKNEPPPEPPPSSSSAPSSNKLEEYRLAKEAAIAERQRLLAEREALASLEKVEAQREKREAKKRKQEAKLQKKEQQRLRKEEEKRLKREKKATSQQPTSPPSETIQETNEPVALLEIQPIKSVGTLNKSSDLHRLIRPMKMPERRYANAAWNYFKHNYNLQTGLVPDRSDMEGTTLWGMGDYLAALQAAEALDIITLKEFDQRVRKLLGVLQQVPLFAGELPHRAYDISTLTPVDYGLNPVPVGTGWSGLDVGRLLVSLHNLKGAHGEYTNAVDNIVLGWSFLRVIRDSRVHSATVDKDQFGRSVTRVKPDPKLGYEEYAARGFQLWGFDVTEAAVGGEYKTEKIEGVIVPVERKRKRQRKDVQHVAVSNPFILYGLELGFDPAMLSLAQPIFEAQAQRYKSKGILTAAGTTLSNSTPSVLNSSISAKKKAWATILEDGTEYNGERMISSAVAFSYYALFPRDEYARELYQSTLDLYNPSLGFYEGVNEKTGQTSGVFTVETNSLVLQSILHRVRGHSPLLVDDSSRRSPWWNALAKGEFGTGLPLDAKPKLELITTSARKYWGEKKNSKQQRAQSNQVIRP